MKSHIYRFADVNVELCHSYGQIVELCKDYESAGQAELSITVTETDIALERHRGEEEDRREQRPCRLYSDGYLETLAAYRKLCEALVEKNIVLFHGSVVAVDGVGYLFTAPSGTGKSTHTRLWRERFGSRAEMINDDKPLIRIENGQVTVYGTPWDGKHRLSVNKAVPLRAICVLSRDTENHIQRVSPKEVFPQILQQCNRPFAPDKVCKTLSLLQQMIKTVSCYRLGCNMESEAAQIAYEAMKEEHPCK